MTPSNKTIGIAIVALTVLAVISVCGMVAIVIVQITNHQAVNIPSGLTEAIGIEITALFGGQLFLGHSQAMSNQADLTRMIAIGTEPTPSVKVSTIPNGGSNGNLSNSPTTSPVSGVPNPPGAP